MAEDIKNQNLSKLALKNSGYSLLCNIILKVSGLIFTMIIARMLMPELFGLYSLAFSIISIFLVFTSFGLEETFLRYLADALGKKNMPKARSYFKFLAKIKGLLVLLVVLIVVFSSKLISYNLYKNPLLFYPLLFSCLFLIMESLWSFFATFFTAVKRLEITVILNVFLQVFKILFSLLALILLSDTFKVSGLFIAFFISDAIILITTIAILIKINKGFFSGPVSDINKKKVLSFLGFMGIASLSLALFGTLDTLILGKFVASEYLGYYRAALSLIFTIAALYSSSGILLPIFTQIHGDRFHRGFKKVMRYMLLLSVPTTIGVLFLGKYFIKVVYGNEYLLGSSALYFSSIAIIAIPLVGVYSIIFQSKEKSKIVSKAVLISLALNVILDLIAIYIFKANPLNVIASVALATALSRAILLVLLAFYAKKEFGMKITGIRLKSIIISTLVMGLFLFVYSKIVNMNLLLGIIEMILAAAIYLGMLIITKGVDKEDWKLINIFNRDKEIREINKVVKNKKLK